MADSSGVDRRTGRGLTDWEHTQQSIGVILTTPLGSRVMRRDFGSEIFDLVDRKMTPRMVLALYAAAAAALARWEPRFDLKSCSIEAAGPDGRITLALFGLFYPRGHLGDRTLVQDASTRIVIGGQP